MGKDKKKHKKEKKQKKLKKEKKRKYSSSDSSESSDGEWVEKGCEPIARKDTVCKPLQADMPVSEQKEVDWGSIFSGVSTSEIRKAKDMDKLKEKILMESKPGQSSRELNPYWKDGGTGLPPEREALITSGSMFKNPIDENDRSSCSRSMDHSRESSGRFKKPGGDEDRHSSKNSRYRRRPDDDLDNTDRGGRFKKPGGDDGDRKSSSARYRKPDENDRKDSYSTKSSYSSHVSSKSRGWKKSEPDSDVQKSEEKRHSPVKDVGISSMSKETVSNVESSLPSPEIKVLTSDKLNELNAKIFRAELAGNTNLVDELKKELEHCRRQEDVDKSVILTQTDSKGYTRPVKRDGRDQGSRNKRKVQTHEDSKRVRYFADDDEYSLQDMYEKEKYSSARDQEEDFMNLMGKEMTRKDGSLALDDPFEETASIDDRSKRGKQQWDRAVRDQTKKEKIYDECKWCLGAKRMNQSLIIKTKQKVYLSCPPFQSLTEGHCLIMPHSHSSCSTQVDEDVWDEVMELRKELVRKFEKNDEDVVFFENASYLHKYPHMIIHCVPVPKEIGDVAPIYFKKALLECESEWTNNKKVVELAGRGVRKAVPKGLPYFFVDFGDQFGYAHVIEDQKLFPNNFAQEIIGGMLDLNHELWRKQRNVSEEELNKNLKYLKQFMCEDDD